MTYDWLREPPLDYYYSVGDWLNVFGYCRDAWHRKFSLDSPVRITRPQGLDNPVHWRVRFPESVPLEQRCGYAVSIPNGRVYGKQCDIISPDHKLIWELSSERKKTPEQHSIRQAGILPPVTEMRGTVAVLYVKDSGVYYHWIIDILPRIELLRRCGVKPDFYVIKGNTSPFHYATLEALGISRGKVIESHEGLHLMADRLVTAGFSQGIRNRSACDFLRAELMEAKEIKPADGYERIYVSRRLARKRRLVNEAELLDRLIPLGFRCLELETLSMPEQIRAFRSAKAVVSPHGAGLTNLIFCEPGTKVIEFFSPLHVHPCYPTISSLMGLEHYYLIGTGPRPPEFINPQDRKADIRLDMSEVSRILRMAGL